MYLVDVKKDIKIQAGGFNYINKEIIMNEHPRTLSTVELISQQALEINHLNYTNSRLSDELAETWHPEFGSIWRYIEMISDLSQFIAKTFNVKNIKCYHSDMYYDPDCLTCEADRLIISAKICIDNITCTKVERMHNAVT